MHHLTKPTDPPLSQVNAPTLKHFLRNDEVIEKQVGIIFFIQFFKIKNIFFALFCTFFRFNIPYHSFGKNLVAYLYFEFFRQVVYFTQCRKDGVEEELREEVRLLGKMRNQN